jgi:hypothetical protein
MILLTEVALQRLAIPGVHFIQARNTIISANLTLCYGRFSQFFCFVFEQTVPARGSVYPTTVGDAILKIVPNKETVGKCDVMFNIFNVVKTTTSKSYALSRHARCDKVTS